MRLGVEDLQTFFMDRSFPHNRHRQSPGSNSSSTGRAHRVVRVGGGRRASDASHLCSAVFTLVADADLRGQGHDDPAPVAGSGRRRTRPLASSRSRVSVIPPVVRPSTRHSCVGRCARPGSAARRQHEVVAHADPEGLDHRLETPAHEQVEPDDPGEELRIPGRPSSSRHDETGAGTASPDWADDDWADRAMSVRDPKRSRPSRRWRCLAGARRPRRRRVRRRRRSVGHRARTGPRAVGVR